MSNDDPSREKSSNVDDALPGRGFGAKLFQLGQYLKEGEAVTGSPPLRIWLHLWSIPTQQSERRRSHNALTRIHGLVIAGDLIQQIIVRFRFEQEARPIEVKNSFQFS